MLVKQKTYLIDLKVTSQKNHIIRTERMLSNRKLEITTTSNESEALLEANLIKNINQNLIFFYEMINLSHSFYWK